MYTQCPDCRAAFRVTASVLQQAAGNVRCGGCGHAFNALDRLSEELPDDNGSPVAQKKSLLESLDEITGTDNIRIEDTGVEWRVLDEDLEDEADDAGTGQFDNAGNDKDGGAVDYDEHQAGSDDTDSVRWFIEDSADDPRDSENGNAEPIKEAPSALLEPAAQASLNLPPADGGPDEERYDDNTPLPGVLDDGGEEPPGLPESPRRRAEDLLESRSPEFDERQVDLALSEPEDWTDLLDEVDSADEPTLDGPLHEGLSLEEEPMVPEPDDDAEAASADFPSDVDTQRDLQVLEMDSDGTGGEFDATGDQPIVDADELTLLADDEAIETGGADEPLPDDALDAAMDADDDGDDDSGFSVESIVVETEIDLEPTGEFERRIAVAATALSGNDSDADNDTGAAAEATPPEPESPGHYVPPQTEEEMTINRLIDQDLLRLAEEENVFASTAAGAGRSPQHEPPFVETIIMEGEFVQNSLETELPSGGSEDKAPIDNQPLSLKDTYTLSLKDTYIRTRDRVRAPLGRKDPPRYVLIAGAAALALLLGGQVVHAYRESLATFGAFDATVGSLYRLFGASITPHWNVNGWQVEATSGSTDALGRELTISSRIANRSGKPLPYPLLHVSLTDRYEEIVGSRVLEPGQYLPDATGNGNVAPGAKFTAVVTISPVSPQADGFKLNVCYRQTEKQVRCATAAFRD